MCLHFVKNMASCKCRISVGILLLCLSNLCLAENICELPLQPMFCSCDNHEETQRISCFVYQNVTPNDLIWDYFSPKRNTTELTFNSQTGNELKFVPTEIIQMLEKLEVLLFRQSNLGILEPYTFSKLISITRIQLDSNEITELQEKCFYRMPKLAKLELSGNYIRRIVPNVFVDLPALQKLYLDRNNITKLEADAFENLKNLSELDLHMNAIRTIQSGAFNGLDHLYRLDLFKNRIEMLKSGVFSPLSKLIDMDLSENLISKIEAGAFKGLDHLITLHLMNNRVKRLPTGLFINVPKLMHTDLSKNHLESVKTETIEELDCRFEDQFVLNIEDNNIKCDCDVWWWITEYLNKSVNPEWKRLLRNVKCQFTDSKGTSYRISSLPASMIGCSDVRITPLMDEENKPVLFVNGITSSESTSPRSSSSQTHALSDQSKETHTQDSTINDTSDNKVIKHDSKVTKEIFELQNNNEKEQRNSALYAYANSVLTTASILFVFNYIAANDL